MGVGTLCWVSFSVFIPCVFVCDGLYFVKRLSERLLHTAKLYILVGMMARLYVAAQAFSVPTYSVYQLCM